MIDYQMQYESLVIGQGTGIGVEVIEGFEDFDASTGDVPIPRGWGDVPGLMTVNSRDITLQLYTKTDADFRTILETFQVVDAPTPLWLKEPGITDERFVYVRPTGRWFTRNPVHKFKKMAAIRLKASDPRIYGNQTTELVATYNAGGGGGVDFNLDYGIDFTGGATGDATVTNNGNIDAYPVIQIYAPSSGTTLTATLTNLTTGQLAEFTFTTDLNPGDIFTADMRRIVTVDTGDTPYIQLSGTNRYGDWDLPRTPFAIVPGGNDLRFEISGTGSDASASVTFRDTSL